MFPRPRPALGGPELAALGFNPRGVLCTFASADDATPQGSSVPLQQYIDLNWSSVLALVSGSSALTKALAEILTNVSTKRTPLNNMTLDHDDAVLEYMLEKLLRDAREHGLVTEYLHEERQRTRTRPQFVVEGLPLPTFHVDLVSQSMQGVSPSNGNTTKPHLAPPKVSQTTFTKQAQHAHETARHSGATMSKSLADVTNQQNKHPVPLKWADAAPFIPQKTSATSAPLPFWVICPDPSAHLSMPTTPQPPQWPVPPVSPPGRPSSAIPIVKPEKGKSKRSERPKSLFVASPPKPGQQPKPVPEKIPERLTSDEVVQSRLRQLTHEAITRAPSMQPAFDKPSKVHRGDGKHEQHGQHDTEKLVTMRDDQPLAQSLHREDVPTHPLTTMEDAVMETEAAPKVKPTKEEMDRARARLQNWRSKFGLPTGASYGSTQH
ncbi:MAG: hypothetical protein M1833_006318 [Piccolia ochrophora]|nr:MAG: hypothetical protein M1833_006318 [Piccolia ochrophora]